MAVNHMQDFQFRDSGRCFYADYEFKIRGTENPNPLIETCQLRVRRTVQRSISNDSYYS